MLADTLNQTSRLAEFLGLAPTSSLLQPAIEKSAADHMRELERMQGKQWISTKGKRTDIPFVRGATSGGWKTKLPESSIAEIENAWGTLMRSLGYELVTSAGADSSEPSEARSDLQVPASTSRTLASEPR
jgi:hypothetical protein